MALAGTSHAATVSGMITNRHGFGIGYCDLTATQAGNPASTVSDTTSRQGAYELVLDEGTWTIEVDPVQLNEWGYQPFSTEIEVTETNPLTLNMLPLPIEPPIQPTLSIRVTDSIFPNEDLFHLLVDGGGDRVFRVERSTNLITWSYYDSACTDNGRIEFGSYIQYAYSNRAIFRVIVTE